MRGFGIGQGELLSMATSLLLLGREAITAPYLTLITISFCIDLYVLLLSVELSTPPLVLSF